MQRKVVGAALTGGFAALAMMLTVLQGVVASQSHDVNIFEPGEPVRERWPAPGQAGVPYRPAEPAQHQQREIKREDTQPEPGDRRKMLPRQWRGVVPELGPRPSKRSTA